jgi:transcriptional regulator with XRE-family HTH domain
MTKKKAPQRNPKAQNKEAERYIGSRVRTARLMINISQEKLADELGLTFQQVQKYEKGTNRIAVSRLLQISKALKQPLAFFVEGLEDDHKSVKQETNYTAPFLASSRGLELARAWPYIEPFHKPILHIAMIALEKTNPARLKNLEHWVKELPER